MLSVILAMGTNAQNSTRQKEVGLTFRGLNSFGITYRTGTESALWRYNVLVAQGENSVSENSGIHHNENNFSGSLRFGREWRKPVIDKLEFRIGTDLSFRTRWRQTLDEDRTNEVVYLNSESIVYAPGVNMVLGLNYTLKDKLVLGTEILPGVSYERTITRSVSGSNSDEFITESDGISYGLSNTSVLMSIAYRF